MTKLVFFWVHMETGCFEAVCASAGPFSTREGANVTLMERGISKVRTAICCKMLLDRPSFYWQDTVMNSVAGTDCAVDWF